MNEETFGAEGCAQSRCASEDGSIRDGTEAGGRGMGEAKSVEIPLQTADKDSLETESFPSGGQEELEEEEEE